ncbi:30S ribosomal protein S18 [candidate division WWE3 bacterium RIFOXYC2_FULL_42_13]|nr:MAG: 30S ribosomal protein S18 [candidate division WWE3 bacterium RIFOXYA2_FULL_43_12]OGC64467.1 MAG: 30S ribosomal protein S18 [candidate division WWE3 bacterium RIFOXYA12_FULL_43_11]OGC72340.1 MAG: 30S ribosomal protein S18 [candidate division WWE3 bacterium RIFOXYB2_FULL_43_9]OGC72826.1 MAG: 30S ribosomal protein S18 [candidate division WWE3 bacterium RIFOXYC2_FULL_42_13]OGC74919.1 MAG: 30S ribosomal protein S18 [candidate division WWE3 bacterium RIFOXYD2_FULL_43_10]
MALKKKTTTKQPRRMKRNTECYFTQTGTKPDYKEALVLRRFISDRGKIIPQKYSGLTSRHQRKLAQEVKKARYMGLIQYTDRHAI